MTYISYWVGHTGTQTQTRAHRHTWADRLPRAPMLTEEGSEDGFVTEGESEWAY